MDTDAKSATRARLLVECILFRADELGLDDRQIAALSRLYWAFGDKSPTPEVVSSVASTLSKEQFFAAVSHFVETDERAQGGGSPDADTVDAMVATALDKRTKDKSVIEIELATSVADRLISWSKTFGIFVAAPAAILLVILSLFGLSKFEDVKNAAGRADELLKQAESRLTDGNAKLEEAEGKVNELTELAKQRAQEVNLQLAKLTENSKDITNQVASLGQTVQRIESQLGGTSAQFETGNKKPGAVSSSPIGKLYGTWGISKETAGTLVTAPNFRWRQDFKGRSPGSREFDSAWQALGERENEGFKDAQQVYLKTKFFDPAAKLLKEQCGLDVAARSQALQETVFDIALNSGAKVLPLSKACKELHEQHKWNLADSDFDESFIRQSYDALAKYSPSFAEGHKQKLLRQLAAEQNKKP